MSLGVVLFLFLISFHRILLLCNCAVLALVSVVKEEEEAIV